MQSRPARETLETSQLLENEEERRGEESTVQYSTGVPESCRVHYSTVQYSACPCTEYSTVTVMARVQVQYSTVQYDVKHVTKKGREEGTITGGGGGQPEPHPYCKMSLFF